MPSQTIMPWIILCGNKPPESLIHSNDVTYSHSLILLLLLCSIEFSKCKEKIGKGELRIGTHSEVNDMKMTAWRHLECFEIPRNKKSEYATNAEFLTEEVEDESDDLLLASEEGIDSIAEKMGSKCEELNAKAKKEKQEKGGKKRKSDAGGKASVSDSELLQKLKEDAELLADAEDDEHGEPAKKKQKLSEMEVKRAEIYTKYAAMKTAELEDILVWNNLVKAGNKTAKMLRIVDGEANGRMGKCPICINGRLRLADSGEKGESNRFEGSSNSR